MLPLKTGFFTEDVIPQNAPALNVPNSQTIPVLQKGRAYYNSAVGISRAGQVPSNCNEMTFVNQGASTVVINQVFRLYPGTPGSVQGDSITFDGKPGEIDVTIYEISFEGGGANNCVVFRKNYQ